MKQYRTIACLLVLLLGASAWAQNTVNYLSSNGDAVTLRVTAHASKASKAIEEAQLEAIKAILFRGIPGSQQNAPLVGVDENKEIKEHPDYFRELLTDKRYASFILSSVPQTKFAKDLTKQKGITMDITVNLKALRTDLEQQKIIRKFGL